MAKAHIVEPVQSMTRAEYRDWSERQTVGRFERIDGVVVAMAPEQVEHNDRKMRAWLALRRAVRDANAPCHVNGDGMTVEVGDSDYEPDAILYCGERLPPGSTTVPNPLIIVEVLSPSTPPPTGRGSFANISASRPSAITWSSGPTGNRSSITTAMTRERSIRRC
jgi:Uma2 family endonuclease